MEQNFIVAIVRITRHLGNDLYLAEDVFDGSEVRVSVLGRMRMVASPYLQLEDECIIQMSPHDVFRGRIITKTSLKGNQSVFGSYLDVRKRYEAKFGPYTNDYTLVKRVKQT